MCPVSKPADHEAAVAKAVDTYGGLHLAVNNAGIGLSPGPIGELDVDKWRTLMSINSDGVVFGMKYQIPAMLAAGGEGTSIVNMSSCTATSPPTRPAPRTPRPSMP
jgi:NAD(P)-dependent dehydrogenase (short-subunit alcohol dehydrogenase family)